jgi:polysaccharide export outer membrane protein
MLRYLSAFIVVAFLISSCNINRDLMFKTDTEFVFDTVRIDSATKEFTLAPNDIFSFDVLTSDGNLIIEASSGTQSMILPATRSVYNQYLIRPDGKVTLPIVGEVLASGYTTSEFQKVLGDLYSQQLVNPYVVVRVINRRALVYNGQGSEGVIVGLLDNNTRLIEVLALAGGLAPRADARKIKIIRKEEGKEMVYLVDLSTIEGIKMADMVIENGDIVYVTPTPDLMLGFTEEILPTVRLLSSIVFLTIVLERFN